MNEILATLHDDHVNMSKLIDLLEQELAAFKEGDAVDIALLQDLMDYMSHYPDGVHHPREDLIARRLAERDPVAASNADSLMAEHGELDDLARRVYAAVNEIALDAELDRDGIVHLVADYVDRLRNHMNREEVTFFPLAERTLLAADWEDLKGSFGDARDPMFGPDMQEKYRSLRDSLLSGQ